MSSTDLLSSPVGAPSSSSSLTPPNGPRRSVTAPNHPKAAAALAATSAPLLLNAPSSTSSSSSSSQSSSPLPSSSSSSSSSSSPTSSNTPQPSTSFVSSKPGTMDSSLATPTSKDPSSSSADLTAKDFASKRSVEPPAAPAAPAATTATTATTGARTEKKSASSNSKSSSGDGRTGTGNKTGTGVGVGTTGGGEEETSSVSSAASSSPPLSTTSDRSSSSYTSTSSMERSNSSGGSGNGSGSGNGAGSGSGERGRSVVPQYPFNVSMVPQTHQGGPTPDDSGITTRLPSICVDYLSHDWAEDDVWTSWKAMTRHKTEIANGVRLENASWRTWAKQRGNLKTISPETLNWLKDSDVTWLYGPLHTAVEAVPPPKVATASERLGLEPLRSLSDNKKMVNEGKENKATNKSSSNSKYGSGSSSSTTGSGASGGHGGKRRGPPMITKPILKYRSLSDILLPPGGSPASPILEKDDYFDTAAGGEGGLKGVHTSKSDTQLARRHSGNHAWSRTGPKRVSVSPGSTSPDRSIASDGGDSTSSSTTGHKSSHEKRHISFNHRVEQCIAVDSTEEAKKYPNYGHVGAGDGSSHDESSSDDENQVDGGFGKSSKSRGMDDDDDDDEEDDVLTFRSSPRAPNGGPAAMSAAAAARRKANEKLSDPQGHHRHHHREQSSEPHTIARLGPTTLKSVELYPSPSPVVVYQNNHPEYSPSSSYSTDASLYPDARFVSASDEPSSDGSRYDSRSGAATAASSASAPGYGASSTRSAGSTASSSMYDYSAPMGSSGGGRVQRSEWDPDDDDDYAMGFDYFNGPDVGVGDEYDMAQYGSTHLIGGTHNNYQPGGSAGYLSQHGYAQNGSGGGGGGLGSGGSSQYSSASSSASTSTENSPRKGSGGTTPVSSSPNSQSTVASGLRGPHAPASSSKDSVPPKRSILKNRGGTAAGVGGDVTPNPVGPGISVVSPSPAGAAVAAGGAAGIGAGIGTGTGAGGLRVTNSSSTASPPVLVTPPGTSPSSTFSSPSTSPYSSSTTLSGILASTDRSSAPDSPMGAYGHSNRRTASSERVMSVGEARGRSASRGSSSSLERAASADRRSNTSISPSSYSPPSPSLTTTGGVRAIGMGPPSRRGGSYESLNSLGTGSSSTSSSSSLLGIGNGSLERSGSQGLPIGAGRAMPDLVEASSESETETERPDESQITIQDRSGSLSPVPGSHSTAANSTQVGREKDDDGEVEVIEDIGAIIPATVDDSSNPSLVPSAVPSPPFQSASSSVKPTSSNLKRQVSPIYVAKREGLAPALDSPPLIPAPTYANATSTTAGGLSKTSPSAPPASAHNSARFRQPSPSQAATASVSTEVVTSDSPTMRPTTAASLSNSPALDPIDLASTPWSDEPPILPVPSYARRSLLRAARGSSSGGKAGKYGGNGGNGNNSGGDNHHGEGREDSVGRGSIDSARGSSNDDYGFGYYEDDGVDGAGIVGRTLEVAGGTARDLLGALTNWALGKPRR